MQDKKSLPKLVVFGDPKKQGVREAIEQFVSFARDKAQIVASYSIEDLKNASDQGATLAAADDPIIQAAGPASTKADVLKTCDFAVVFGGDGSIISTARIVSRASVPVIGVN
ncbi:MAG: hypothetical protein AMJ75_06115, partial [Phycisphaerae bacterium SM1_79]